MITILFFGPVAERVGANRLAVDYHPGMCVQDVQAKLQEQYPAAFELVSLVAVDGAHVRDKSIGLTNNSEVVFMSKFSGG
jgi:sulfur-carrier protein